MTAPIKPHVQQRRNVLRLGFTGAATLAIAPMAWAQSNTELTEEPTMSALSTLETFLGHIFTGEMAEALSLVADDAKFISANPRPNPANKLHGTFVGVKGAQDFFAGFLEVLEPGEFNVEDKFGEGSHAAMYGTLRHTVRSTGKPFISNWALIGNVEGGKLTLYHFYEDSEALSIAMR